MSDLGLLWSNNRQS